MNLNLTIMKNVLLFLLTVSFLACSGDDSSDSANSSNYYNPPAWIQGNWGINGVTGSPTVFYKFTTDNVCQITNNVTEFCWSEQVEFMQSNNLPVTYSESIGDTQYSVSFGQNGATTNLVFEKISDTKIKWVNGNNAELIKM